ncbi:MAG: hypothetical protein ACKPKO_62640, partial [Candidatus Fonsibacter sp.]
MGLNRPRSRSRSCSPPRDAGEFSEHCAHVGDCRFIVANMCLCNKLVAKEAQALADSAQSVGVGG